MLYIFKVKGENREILDLLARLGEIQGKLLTPATYGPEGVRRLNSLANHYNRRLNEIHNNKLSTTPDTQ